MRLFIPPLGTELTLAEDWTFTLHNEWRNEKLVAQIVQAPKPHWREYGQPDYNRRYEEYADELKYRVPGPVTLPAGTVLIVDRIYIRKGAGDFDSVTFRIKESPSFKKARFWAKLDDVNKMEISA